MTLASLLFLALPALADDAAADTQGDAYASTVKAETPYIFGWLDFPAETGRRGGTSRGAPVTLQTEPSDAWRTLQEDGLSAQERDRRAILALAGDYRASFDFLDTEVYGDTKPAPPYRSWGTERVYVLADTPTHIELQHVMTMYMQGDDGEVLGPFVMKHWRQDWDYEPTTLMAYQGHRRFDVRTVSEAERAGAWSQTVYHVDDSPRYAMIGRWHHNAARSAWDSDDAWRTLPRRERSFRDDYDVLGGTNRITVTATGWVHTQDNSKIVLTGPGEIDASNPMVARELGVNRYDRIVDFGFEPGDAYWAATQDYWAMVRAAWAGVLTPDSSTHVSLTCGEEPAFQGFFELASRVESGKKLKPKKLQQEVDALMACVVGE